MLKWEGWEIFNFECCVNYSLINAILLHVAKSALFLCSIVLVNLRLLRHLKKLIKVESISEQKSRKSQKFVIFCIIESQRLERVSTSISQHEGTTSVNIQQRVCFLVSKCSSSSRMVFLCEVEIQIRHLQVICLERMLSKDWFKIRRKIWILVFDIFVILWVIYRLIQVVLFEYIDLLSRIIFIIWVRCFLQHFLQ